MPFDLVVTKKKCNQIISLELKMRLFDAVVITMTLCAAETWRLTKEQLRELINSGASEKS